MKQGMYENTNYAGIKKLLGKPGYVAVLDYGRQPRVDKKTGKMVIKQIKKQKHFDTLKEARQAMAEAAMERKMGSNTSGIRSTKFSDMTEDFKKSERYKNLEENYRKHYDNYINHFIDFFGEMEVSKISVIDMENYYRFQMERGNLNTAKKNKDGTVNKKEGITINTVQKHKTAAKRIWEFMIDARVYGVTENIAEKSSVPKAEIIIDGKVKKVAKIPYHPRSLTLEELNETLNDAAQHEFDRSVILMIGLGAVGGLRHSEVTGLQMGKVLHNELMNISDEIWEMSGYDNELYKVHDEYIMIDTAIMDNKAKFPKSGIVRVAAVPRPLRQILDYAMEQRKEVLDIAGRALTGSDNVYLPLINIIKNQPLNSQKLTRKWTEYQKRRNRRMEEKGLAPIPVIRFHDLRHTFSNLTKPVSFEWERSYNMGHKVLGDNTTNKVYINDRTMERGNIIKFFNENIKIDWDRAMHKKINVEGSRAYVNGSGHLVISTKEMEERKKQHKKFVFKEDEMVELLGN